MSEPAARPLLRGVSHLVAFFVAWPFLLRLVQGAATPERRACAAVYAASLLGLLGTSALYHRRTWTPAGRARMRAIDHSAVFLLIAGTYTPISLLAVGGRAGLWLCAAVWAGALGGVAQTLFWPKAPRALHVGFYVLLGWAGLFGLVAEVRSIGYAGMLTHLIAGCLYTLGAVIYARKRPDPFPHVFGYHEIFHVLVILACGCLFDVVYRSLHHGP